MAINWTKLWSASDDGTILKGADIGTIQTDLNTAFQNSTQIQGINVAAPTAADDDMALFYDHGNSIFDYAELVSKILTTAGDTVYQGAAGLERLAIGAAGAIYMVNAGATAPSWLALGTAGGILKVNAGATALEYLALGSAGGILQVNAGATALEYLGIGTAGQTLTVNSGATAAEWATPVVAGTQSFSAYSTSGTSTQNGQDTKISFNNENFDTNSNYDHSTNYRYTAPADGKYIFGASTNIYKSGTSGGFAVGIYLRKNGNDVVVLSGMGQVFGNEGDGSAIGGAVILDLSEDDYIEAWLRGLGSSTHYTSMEDSNSTDNCFWGYRIA